MPETFAPRETIMIEHIERAMNSPERAVLQERIGWDLRRSSRILRSQAAWIGSLTVIWLTCAGAGWSIVHLAPAWIPATAVLVLIGSTAFAMSIFAIISLLDYIRHSRGEEPLVSKNQLRLDQGCVRVRRVSSNHAIEIKAYEDETEACLYGLSDGTTFLLLGQHVSPEDSDSAWPADVFEIVDSAFDGERIGLFSIGKPLEPALRLWSDCLSLAAWNRLPAGENIVPGTPMEILTALNCDFAKSLDASL
jgi:hypothetical protein